MNSTEEWVNDLFAFYTEIVKMYTKLPIFMLALGSGCPLVSYTLLKKGSEMKPAGIIFGGMIFKKPEMGMIATALSGFALKLMPEKTGAFSPDFTLLSRNKTNTKIMIEDPLVNKEKIFAGNIKKVMEMQEYVKEQSEKMQTSNTPLVIIQGEKDKMGQGIACVEAFEKLKYKDKELWYYPDAWGAVLAEQEYYDIEKRLVQWILKRS